MSNWSLSSKNQFSRKKLFIYGARLDHSISRIGIEENNGEPLYNWDLCQVGATAAH